MAPAAAASPPGPANAPYDAWGLREHLRQTSPDTFGGLYTADGGTLVITAVRGHGAAMANAKSAFDAKRVAGTGRAMAAIRHHVSETVTSMRRLETLNQAALDAFDTESASI
jgi:hypothetical protein